MSGARWGWMAVQAVAWAGAFCVLLLARWWVERWMFAWLHRRRVTPSTRCQVDGVWGWHLLAAVIALVAGSVVPLAPELRVGRWQVAWHLWGSVEVALLLAVVMLWVSGMLLALPYGRSAVRRAAATTVANALPAALLALSSAAWQHGSLMPTAGARAKGVELALRLLSLPLWAVCLAPPQVSPHARGSMAWHVQASSSALLAGLLSWGAWPTTLKCVGVGLAFTLFEMAAVTALWSLMWVTFPVPRLADVRRRGREVALLAAINLLLSVSWISIRGG